MVRAAMGWEAGTDERGGHSRKMSVDFKKRQEHPSEVIRAISLDYSQCKRHEDLSMTSIFYNFLQIPRCFADCFDNVCFISRKVGDI